MRLFLLPPDFCGQETLTLSGSDCNYIVNVLRLKEGREITGRDASGKTWLLTLTKIRKGSCTLSVREVSETPQTTDTLPENRPSREIILYQCLPKGRKMDEIIKRATEMGVRAIVPVRSRNCIAEANENRTTRYMAMVKEAVQQSGSLVPTEVTAPVDIKDVPLNFKNTYCGEKGFFFHQNRLTEKQRNLLQALQGTAGPYAVIIGPEGGFTDEECELLMAGGFEPILLKTNILRCETAALYAVAALQTISESL